MQQNITESVITESKPRFDTEGRVPTWYRADIMPKKVGHILPDGRVYIGSGEDYVQELKLLMEEEECTS